MKEKAKMAWSSERGEETMFQSLSKKRKASSWNRNTRDSSQRQNKRGRRRRDVSEILINDDVLEEIILRLPVKSLICFQTVSKQWRVMITSRRFKERYMLHQKTLEPKFLFLYDDKSWYKANITLRTMRLNWSTTCLVGEEEEEEEHHINHEHKGKVLAVSNSLDGLVCVYGYKDLAAPIKVINPATRWSQNLPLASVQLEHRDSNMAEVEFPFPGFGKDYVTGTYKLVWLHYNVNTSSPSCEVFDFGVKQWRQVTPPPPGHHRINQNQAPDFVNGWLYWISLDDMSKWIAFDLHMETFRVVPNPIVEASSSPTRVRMYSRDDETCLMWISVTYGDGMQHVWRLTNHNTGGVLLKMDKIFSFDMKKITSTWFDNHDSSLFLHLTAISRKGDKFMLSKPCSQNLLLYQPLSSTSILRMFSYSHPLPEHSVLRPYFPTLASPL